jgi:hypothetical protein
MTAVEWLANELIRVGYFEDIKPNITFEQAKEMEKEQLEKVWKAAEQNMRSQFSSSAYKNVTFDEYYKQQIR